MLKCATIDKMVGREVVGSASDVGSAGEGGSASEADVGGSGCGLDQIAVKILDDNEEDVDVDDDDDADDEDDDDDADDDDDDNDEFTRRSFSKNVMKTFSYD